MKICQELDPAQFQLPNKKCFVKLNDVKRVKESERYIVMDRCMFLNKSPTKKRKRKKKMTAYYLAVGAPCHTRNVN